MRRFISQDPYLAISHTAIKAAAENEQYVLTFTPDPADQAIGRFETASDPVADALAALAEANKLGVEVRELAAEKPKK